MSPEEFYSKWKPKNSDTQTRKSFYLREFDDKPERKFFFTFKDMMDFAKDYKKETQ